MTALASHPTAFTLRAGDEDCRIAPGTRLALRATEDGWSLIAPDGQLVFRGMGLAARRQCLLYARAHGVLAVTG
jgi:hypothetical protein